MGWIDPLYKEHRAEFSVDTIRLLSRWYRLRKRGLCRPLIQDGTMLWTFTDDMNPWGSRERITVEELRAIVEEAERDTR